MPPARAAAARPPRHWRSGVAQRPPPPRQLPALPGGVHAVTAKRARWADNSQDMCSAWPPLRTHSDGLYAVHRAMHGAVGDFIDPCLQYAISSLQGHWHGLAKQKACNRRESPLYSTCAGLQNACERLSRKQAGSSFGSPARPARLCFRLHAGQLRHEWPQHTRTCWSPVLPDQHWQTARSPTLFSHHQTRGSCGPSTSIQTRLPKLATQFHDASKRAWCGMHTC